MKRTAFGISELDRLVKFVHELNELGKKYQVGISAGEDIYLTIGGDLTPLILDSYDSHDLSVVVPV